MLLTLKQTLKNLIATDPATAFDSLRKALSPNSPQQNTFSSLCGRLSGLNREKIEGTISFENASVARNQIVTSFIVLVDSLSDGDIQAEQQLRFQIEKLQLNDPVGELHLVNCNRSVQDSLFWNTFEQRRPSHFQFYFINACNSQMPQSLSERIIYELIEYELEDELSAMNLRTEPGSRRVKIENLPLGPTQVFSERKFKTYFCERFLKEFGEANQLSFDDFLRTGVPKLRSSYVATVFQVTKWEPFMPTYLDWILKTCQTAHANVPTFLFFFPVMLKGFTTLPCPPEHGATLDAIHQLVSENAGAATLIEPLPPVKREDLDAWLLDLGEGNPLIRERVIRALVDTFLPERRQLFLEKNLLDMCDVEILQESVYDFAQRG